MIDEPVQMLLTDRGYMQMPSAQTLLPPGPQRSSRPDVGGVIRPATTLASIACEIALNVCSTA